MADLETKLKDIWKPDRLGYREMAETFTTLVQSVTLEEEGSKVISLEAGFGWGKTFFQEHWARHLDAVGEVVIQIDAQQSDHSGDPVVTFLGALMAALPEQERSAWMTGWATGKRVLWGGAKIAATVAARQAGADAIEALEGKLSADGETSALDEALLDFAKGASKALSSQVAEQLAAERTRTKEMPEQLKALREALTEGRESKRIVILIDELDRCHPDYVISLMEAMKLVFNQPGFVFVLMVNDAHLQALAEQRFGAWKTGERYLDKFVDLRLRLKPTEEQFAKWAGTCVKDIMIGLGQDPRPSDWSKDIVESIINDADLSARDVVRMLQRIELTLRCNQHLDLELPLLAFLAVAEAKNTSVADALMWGDRPIVPKALFHGSFGQELLNQIRSWKGNVSLSKGRLSVYLDAGEGTVQITRSDKSGVEPPPMSAITVEDLIAHRIIDKHIAVLRAQPIA